MKLQKQVNRRIGDEEYLKYVVVIPPEQIEKLHWHGGVDLDSTIERDKLVIKLHKGSK